MTTPQPNRRALSSKTLILRVSRQEWDTHVGPNGALDEAAHHARVRRLLMSDPDFVRLRGAEVNKRLDDDIVESVRRLRGLSKPTAKEIITTGVLNGTVPVQQALPLKEFARQKYEIPLTGETKAGPALTVQEGEAVQQEIELRAAELTVKARYLRAVLNAARAKKLLATDRLAKVWA